MILELSFSGMISWLNEGKIKHHMSISDTIENYRATSVVSQAISRNRVI